LDSGKIKNIHALADKLKLSRSYVSQTLMLNELAPDIVSAVLDGGELYNFSLAKCRGLRNPLTQGDIRRGSVSINGY
jgi:hypothetical protein